MSLPRSPLSALFRILAGAGQTVPLTDPDWRVLLEFADRTQLTLHLRHATGLPEWVREEIEARFARNAERRARLYEAVGDLAHAFSRNGIEFVLLKGFTHETGFGLEPGTRVQYDIDLLSPHTAEARRVLRERGYRPHGASSLSDEHGRPWVRPTNWTWRGDYFDPQMPIAVEVHSTPWSPRKDRIELTGPEQFWNRRLAIEVSGVRLTAYCEPDRVAFAALHVLRHLLRNDARPAHVYELARFLHTRRLDAAFWTTWQSMHTDDVKSTAAIAFRFAQEWFGCAPLETVELESVAAWFREFAWSPVMNLIEPNKDIVWLHLALVHGMKNRLAVMRSRLAPLRIPHPGEAPDLRPRFAKAHWWWKRVRYHAAGSTLAVARGARWWLRRTTSSTISHTSDWYRAKV